MTARRLPALRGAARAGVERIFPLAGSRPRELARVSTLALVAGDWPVAAAAGRARLGRHPADEGARVALAVALWELGREDQARALVREGGAAGVRFHRHLDEPAGAEAALGAIAAPPAGLLCLVGDAWRRHGDLDRALALADRALAARPGHPEAGALRRGVLAERAVEDGSWAAAGGRPARAGAPCVPGRVLHLLEWSLPQRVTGSTYRSAYVVEAQAAAGLDPHVVTQPGFAAGAAEEVVAGAPHHRLARGAPAGAPVDVRLRDYLEGAARVVERLRPAVLHPATDYVNALVALELGRRHGIPVVYEVRGFPELTPARWGRSRAALEKSAFRHRIEARARRQADRVVTLAEVMKRHIAAQGVDPARIAVLPNAVDVARFPETAPDPALRARLGIAEDELVVGYVGSVGTLESLATIVEAVARLAARGRRVRALIVGDGLERGYLRQVARRLGVEGLVVLPGQVPHADVARHYALIDVFVVPRRPNEVTELVTPLKPYEAMAARRPVVVSRIPALQEMIEEERTGVSFAPGDAADLARVVGRLADDPAARRRLGEQARAWVAEHRTWAGNAERYVELYGALGAL